MTKVSKICYIEIRVEVEADYIPAQPAEMPSPSNETGTPPEAEEFDITAVRMIKPSGEVGDAIAHALSPEQFEQLEEQVKEQLEADDRMYTNY